MQGDANRCIELGVGPKKVEGLTMDDQLEGVRPGALLCWRGGMSVNERWTVSGLGCSEVKANPL